MKESVKNDDISIKYTGYIKDENSKTPIYNAKITFQGKTNEFSSKYTDSEGLFLFNLQKELQNVKIIISHDKYEPKEIIRTLTNNTTNEPDEIYLNRKPEENYNTSDYEKKQLTLPDEERITTKKEQDKNIQTTQEKRQIQKPNSEWKKSEAEKESEGLNIEFAAIEMVSQECLWEDFEYDEKKRPPYSSHVLATFMWTKDSIVNDKRIADPVFDISLINSGNKPILITKVGFQAIRYWSSIKGLPVTGKVKISDSFELKVKEFVPEKDYYLKLPDKVHIESGGVYRFKLRLTDYRKAVMGNESVIKISLEVNGKRIRSEEIYLGLF